MTDETSRGSGSTAAPLVLVVEDDSKIAGILIDYLRAAGYETARLAEGVGVIRFVRERSPALVLLDLRLPGRGGLEVCRALRAFSAVPIIMVTALVEEADRLVGLESGADDYICKPFSPREVVARVKAVLRRPPRAREAEAGGPRLVGPFGLDEERRRISFRGRGLDLTSGEYRILRRMVANPGRVFSRGQLLDALHGTSDDSFDRAIDTHIKNLRKKIAKIEPGTTMIRSVYGVGYRLDVE